MAHLPETVLMTKSLGLESVMDVTIPYVWSFVHPISLLNAGSYSPVADASHHLESLQPEQPGGKTQREVKQMQRTEQAQASL